MSLPAVFHLPGSPRNDGRGGGFTLIELLLSMVVLTLIIVAVANLAGSANFAWLQGERNVEVYQNGRAVLELMSRELSQASMSNRLQFIQSPGDLPIPPSPEEPQQVPASPIFWQAPLADTPKGNLCEIGYYLVRLDPKAGAKGVYQLKRFFVRPDNANNYYQIFNAVPAVNSATWITGLDQNAFSSTSAVSVVTTLSEGVLGLWVRCLDGNGDSIPWMNLAGGRANGPAGGIKFNSAGCFRPAIPGQAQSFAWTNAQPPATPPTAQTYRLPASVEITIAQVDQRTANQRTDLPNMASSKGPEEMPVNIAKMQQAFDSQHIMGGHIFATRVKLPSQ